MKNRIQVNLNLKQVKLNLKQVKLNLKQVKKVSQFFKFENAIFFGLNKVPRYKFAILIVMFLMVRQKFMLFLSIIN